MIVTKAGRLVHEKYSSHNAIQPTVNLGEHCQKVRIPEAATNGRNGKKQA